MERVFMRRAAKRLWLQTIRCGRARRAAAGRRRLWVAGLVALAAAFAGASAVGAAEWRSYTSKAGYHVLNMEDGETGEKAFIGCNGGESEVFVIRLRIPFERTRIPEDLWPRLIEGGAYRLMMFAELDGAAGGPVQHFGITDVSFRDDRLVSFALNLAPKSPAGLSRAEAAAALGHLQSGKASLALAVGHSVKNPRPFYSRRFDLSGAAPLLDAGLLPGCPDLAEWRGIRPMNEEVASAATRRVQWYDFESTRFTAAQRKDFEARAREILGESARSVACAYRRGGGVATYEFWSGVAPEGVAELARLSGRGDTRGAELGTAAVTHCPANEDAARLLRSMSQAGSWPPR